MMYMIMYSELYEKLEISIDPETLAQVDRAAKPLGLKRSEVVRQALANGFAANRSAGSRRNGLQRCAIVPGPRVRLSDWLGAQAWSKK